jgi:cytochrome c oxidase subunit 4
MRVPPLTPKTLVLVFVALWVCVLATTLIGFIDLGQFNIVVAVAFAAIMAILVAGFFMHALYEGKLVHIMITGGIVWFLIMETLTLGDFMTRGWLPFPGK